MLIKTPSGGLVNLPSDFEAIEIRQDHYASEMHSVIAVMPGNSFVPILENVPRESCYIVCDAIEIALLDKSEHLSLSPALVPTESPTPDEPEGGQWYQNNPFDD